MFVLLGMRLQCLRLCCSCVCVVLCVICWRDCFCVASVCCVLCFLFLVSFVCCCFVASEAFAGCATVDVVLLIVVAYVAVVAHLDCFCLPYLLFVC